MSADARSLGGQLHRPRHFAFLKWPREWRRGLDKDLRLLLTIALIVVVALTISLATIREVERQLLRSAATGAAVHWAEFLQSHLRGLDEILAAGLVSEDDQRIFEFAGAAGGVQDYQVIRPDGVVALSNWSGDFRGATNAETLRDILDGNRTLAMVIEEAIGDGDTIIGQAYVPLTSGSGKRGALKVDVDVTSLAARYRSLGNGAFAALIALLLPPGGLAGWLVARNILAQRRSERLQRQRGLVLEALTRGVDLDRVLLRIARFVERHRQDAFCAIVTLDPSAEKVAACIAQKEAAAWLDPVGQPVATLPAFYAELLRTGKPSRRRAQDGTIFWSTPLQASSGSSLGSLIVRCPPGVRFRPPDPEGPEVILAQLAAFAIEARRAGEAIAEMRQRNELILGAAADGIFGVDAEGRITFANPAAARILGRRVAELIGSKADATLRPSSAIAQGPAPVAASLVGGVVRHIEKLEIRGRDEAVITVELVVTPIGRQLSSLSAVVVFHDISAQIAAQMDLYHAKEEAEAASRSKSSFLAHMSHELRTPLNAIIGFSEVMAEETLGPLSHPQYREYVEHIHSSGAHLLSLINDLLDLSKIEAGKLELWEETTDLAKVFERCRIFVAELAQHKGVTLSIADAGELPHLKCDHRKLKQVLVNLLANAVKFTPAGGRVELEAKTDGAEGIDIRVSDNGVGIASDDLDTVMAPFGQAREAMVRGDEGTGLGLPLAKALVELHGGSLELQSRQGEGTTVTVRLPGRALPPGSGAGASLHQLGKLAG
ncbi:MAG: ATP-binding protein [Kiloniellaceae bacterium]